MYNLSKPQQIIYDMTKVIGGSVSTICGSVLKQGSPDTWLLKKCVNELYRLNDALRIHIREANGQPVQYVADYTEKDIEVLRFDNENDFTQYADSLAQRHISLYDDLAEIYVIIVGNKYGIVVTLHHIISDAWTATLLAQQYIELVEGNTPTAYSYMDYINDECRYINSTRYENDKKYWLDQFIKCDEVTYLNEQQTKTYNSKRATYVIGKDKTAEIQEYIKNHNASAYSLFMTLFAVYMNRIKSNRERFYIGTAVLNRSGVKEKNTLGMYINTVPLLFDIDNEDTFAECMHKTMVANSTMFRHQKYNYIDILKDIREQYNFNELLYDVIISYQNAKIQSDDVATEWYCPCMQTESLQIHIDDRDNEGILKIHYDYQTDKFTEKGIKRIYEHMFNILNDAMTNENKKIYELDILSNDERNKLLYEFNNTKADYPKDKCVHQLFEEQVLKTPDKTAVIACDKTLTYDKLNKMANRIANALIEKGIGIGDIVAFALPRTSYLIPVMFGILKSGAAYMPVDLDYPQDRIDFMLADSNAKLFITAENINEYTSENAQKPDVKMTSDNCCYCIYTSGSTGNPKGVLIKHLNVVNFCYSSHLGNVINDCRYIVGITKIVFDLSVRETLYPLLNGLSIIFANENESIIQSEINNLLLNKIHSDILVTTPSKMKLFIADNKCEYLKYLKCIILGGEALDEELYFKLHKLTNAEVYNEYGPTETTVFSSCSKIESKNITIGKPIANTQIYILDKYNKLMPIGQIGELCIAGDGVGTGYLNRPELTAEKFIDNPFGDGKMYKTGDLAYWRKDGNIMFVGRNDFQVKIRGLRIELEEIENAICSVNGISQAVVIVRKDETGRQRICAFYTETSEVDIAEIRNTVTEKLPKYMLPHIFTRLIEIPLTPSGKINRKALPDVDLDDILSGTEYIKPQTELQKEIVRLMEQVLKYKPVGLNDNFFELGGDSLMAIEFLSKAHSEGIYFDLQAVFDNSTVKKLCEYIETGDKETITYKENDFVEINKILAKNSINSISAPKAVSVGNVLIAGATGYLGIHILADFLNNNVGTAYCLVRGDNKIHSENRLKELLQFYFNEKYSALLGTRIKVLCSDLTKQNLDLSNEDYTDLLQNITTVINAAASVKHYGSYKYFYESNIESVKNLIGFCLKAGARLVHTSTLSVSGNSMGDDFNSYISDTEKRFYESSLYIGQPLENVYVRSKFEAEKEILLAMVNGLKANIMRMGNLTNRFSDGKFQINHESNAYLKRVRAFLDLGVFPDYLMHLYTEYTPIDDAARAVMTITRYFSNEQTVFHINSTKVVYWDKLLKYFNDLGVSMKIVDEKTFTNALRQTVNQTSTEFIYETFINDMDHNDRLNYDSNIRIENDFTSRYLQNLGFNWSDIDFEYIKKYINYFRKIKYLDV